jgi:exopolysaccharide biosynthesis predicted pyruvyltransferase EpsI
VTSSRNSSATLIAELQDRLARRVQASLPAEATVALVDFPHHNNIGDTAIWMGELALLQGLGVRLAARADEASYSPRRIRSALGSDGVVLLHGGGNFGDLWPRRQAFREQVVRDFPEHRVVQLPQTVSVSGPRALESMRSLIAAHGGVTLLVRDRRSADVCREQLGVDADVVPDAAFALGTFTRPCAPVVPIICLARSDHEARSARIDSEQAGMVVVDWFDGLGKGTLRPAALVRTRRIAAGLVGSGPITRRLLGRAWETGFDVVAHRRLDRGTRLLSAGEVVVTDRLHGHILSLLLGIPHVAVDTTRGKLGGFIDAFTASSPLVHRAASFADARGAAELILAEMRNEPYAGPGTSPSS